MNLKPKAISMSPWLRPRFVFAIVGDKVVLSAHTGKVVDMNITSRLKKSEVVDMGKTN